SGGTMHLLWILLTFFAFQSQSNAGNYEFLPANEKFFSDCPDHPPSSRNISGLFDLTNITFSLSAEGLTIGGNTTSAWDIQQEDRVELELNTFFLERGTWQPTVFTLTSKDFCSVMYDERQYWYKYWSKYIKNAEEVKDRCLNVLGTKLFMETYVMNMHLSSRGPIRDGFYKYRLTFRAFDSSGVERPTYICFEFIGDLFKI
ncbi:hypothetical protein KR009_011291, partial [Drosophila setifemur]